MQPPHEDVDQNRQTVYKIELLEDESDLGACLADTAIDTTAFLNTTSINLDQRSLPSIGCHQACDMTQAAK